MTEQEIESKQIVPYKKSKPIINSISTLIKHLWKPAIVVVALAGTAYSGFEAGRFYEANMPIEHEIGHQNTSSRAYQINGQVFVEQSQDTKAMVTREESGYSTIMR